jgi:hypothetical protein
MSDGRGEFNADGLEWRERGDVVSMELYGRRRM